MFANNFVCTSGNGLSQKLMQFMEETIDENIVYMGFFTKEGNGGMQNGIVHWGVCVFVF